MIQYHYITLGPQNVGVNNPDSLKEDSYRNYRFLYEVEKRDRKYIENRFNTGVFVFSEGSQIGNAFELDTSVDGCDNVFNDILIYSLSEKINCGVVTNINNNKFVYFDDKGVKFYVGKLSDIVTSDIEISSMSFEFRDIEYYEIGKPHKVKMPCIVAGDKIISMLNGLEIADKPKSIGIDFMNMAIKIGFIPGMQIPDKDITANMVYFLMRFYADNFSIQESKKVIESVKDSIALTKDIYNSMEFYTNSTGK